MKSADRLVESVTTEDALDFYRRAPRAIADLNPDSLEILEGALVESSLAASPEGETVQFERRGYFCKDPDSTQDRPVFNRTCTLRDTWEWDGTEWVDIPASMSGAYQDAAGGGKRSSPTELNQTSKRSR